MSTGEAARRCGLSRHTLLRAARRGDLLPASRTPGGDLRFRAADVEAFAEQLAHPLPPAGGIGQDGVRRPQGGFSPRWDRLVAASPDLMCVADTRGFFKWVNPAFTTLLGWSSEELLAFPYAHFLHPDDHDRTYTVEALLRQGKPVAAFENRYRCTDGSWRWIAWTTTPWSSDGLLYAVGRDVTERRHLEDALRANEERFRSAFEDAGIGMAIVDVDGGLVHVNSAFCTLVGYTKEELLQSAWPTLTDPDDLAASHALAQRLIASQTRFEILEKRFIHKDGHAVWVVLSSTLVRDADGQPRYFISQIQDISSRKAAERHMRILADLLDQAHDAVIVRDPVTSTITYWNRGAERLYGWTPDAALGRVIQAVFPEPKEAVDATLERDGEWLGQVVYTGRDGRQRYVESRQVLRRDAQGRPEAVLEINRDITDQKRAEAELRASEHSLRALIAKAPVGAAIIDERGILEVVNSAYAAIFGYTPAEMIGQSCGMVVAAEQRPAFVAKALELLAGGQEAAGETEAIHRDGRPLVLWFTGSTVSWTDGRPRRASFVIDITQRKHAEDRLAYASQHDALTSLPNRVLFADRLEQALHTVDRERASLALLLIDLDGFKVVNDTLGHAAGDRLLREVGRRLQAAVRVSDTVARLGGDEFAVLVPGTEEGGAIRVAE
jgi:PAS domain S-box-containing protein/excisionase family DNA binding protein